MRWCVADLTVLLVLFTATPALTQQANPYTSLGVNKKSSDAEIKQAYRKLALKYHPDKNRNNKAANNKFIAAQLAYETLSDPVKKRDYDLGGSTRQSGGGQWQHSQGQGSWSGHQQHHDPGGTDTVLPSATTQLTSSNLRSHVLYSNVAWLIQIYAEDSPACRTFSPTWEALHKLIAAASSDGARPVASLGRINFRYQRNLAFWASSGGNLNWQDLPIVLGVRRDCVSPDCFVRYRGPLTSQALQDFLAWRMLDLKPILTVQLEGLDAFLKHAHQAKTVAFALSKTGSQGSLLLRQFAHEQAHMMTFARVVVPTGTTGAQWAERLGVGTVVAPSMVVLRGPGSMPEVLHVKAGEPGAWAQAIKDNGFMWHQIAALRPNTLEAMNCLWGAEAALSHTPRTAAAAQLCVAVVGRGTERIHTMRVNMLQVSRLLAQQSQNTGKQKSNLAADALMAGKLRLTWVDASVQRLFCTQHFASAGHSSEAAVCGQGWQARVNTWVRAASALISRRPLAEAQAELLGPPPRAALLAYRPAANGPGMRGASHMFATWEHVDMGAEMTHSQVAEAAEWINSVMQAAALVPAGRTAPLHLPPAPLRVLPTFPAPLVDDEQQAALEFLEERIGGAVRSFLRWVAPGWQGLMGQTEVHCVLALVATGLLVVLVHQVLGTAPRVRPPAPVRQPTGEGAAPPPEQGHATPINPRAVPGVAQHADAEEHN